MASLAENITSPPPPLLVNTSSAPRPASSAAVSAAPSAIKAAVGDMTVAEVRRCLSQIRRSWEVSQLEHSRPPVYLSQELGVREGVKVDEFALRFILSHHNKRSSRGVEEPPLLLSLGEDAAEAAAHEAAWEATRETHSSSRASV